MFHTEIKTGMKVVPFKKTGAPFNFYKGNHLSSSEVWGKAQKKGQKFLYVQGYDVEERCWVLDVNPPSNRFDGDFFAASDFEEYKGEREKQPGPIFEGP